MAEMFIYRPDGTAQTVEVKNASQGVPPARAAKKDQKPNDAAAKRREQHSSRA